MKHSLWIAGLAIVLGLLVWSSLWAGCAGDDDDDDAAEDDDSADDDAADDDDHGDDDDGPVYGYGLWPAETGPDVLAQWYPFFAQRKSELYVEVLDEWIYSRNQDVARIFREAHEAGVHARPYIILSIEDGLYPNEANFDQFFEATKALIQWAEEEDLPIDWICVDMETPVQMVDQINQYLAEFRLLDIYLLLLDHKDPVAFEQSVANYQMLVDYCHDHGFKVMEVSFPFVLDDYSDNDFGIQDAFDIPVSGVAWDEVDFMVYRTMYQGYSTFPITSKMVYRYGLKALELFGERASIFIGLVLWPGWFEGDLGYHDPAELEADIEAALAAGIRRIHVFYLTGLLSKDDPEAWMDPDVSNPTIPEEDPFSTLLIDVGMPLLDAIL